MAEEGKENTNRTTEVSPGARSTPIAEGGVHTGEDFARLMSALMSDVIEGRIAPEIANATCNAGGKLLKVVEMQYKYAGQGDTAQPLAAPTLVLAREKV